MAESGLPFKIDKNGNACDVSRPSENSYDIADPRYIEDLSQWRSSAEGRDLTVPKGMYGLLGPNGAGKSTLMRILATLQEPDGGSVQLGGIDVLNQKDEVRKTLGYLPQEFGVYPKVNAEDLLEHFAILKGIAGRRARKEVVEALLRQTNLWDVRKQKLGGYSGGMRQRFGVAVALLGNPKLMIVDEPTAGLDPAERVRF
jgi:ABC-type multidrug transport system ATPase subunit